jgi:metal-dependent amidase/aminoacylase/carboxypeptidase family protein
MITTLAPLGAKYNLQFVPEYGTDGTVTVAVIYTAKAKDAVPKSLTFSGTIAEVETALVTDLPKVVDRLIAHATTLEALDVELKNEKAAKEAELKAVKKQELAKAVAKPTKTVTEPAPVAPAAPATPLPTGLKPAWKKPVAAAPVAVAVAEDDIGSMFEEEGS